ncbi:hypothetical protein HQ865_11255 [Mucilaginibacter mali]|uniref:Lipoprotein n=1 Tax=Mucilaginibacter mali TaxID=2740462 RepID=A0A7D4TMS1_9SPHI|nr:hypothetical protein [Mucilaginibacter mali]QKJ30313.1 hypothetical protein HQ865_11255 [Mucilaginibacter mali]
MGYKIITQKKVFLSVCLFLSISACRRSDFLNSDDTDTSYQICPGISDIIRVKYPEENGAPTLQLFDNNGTLLKENTINPMSRFLLTEMNNKAIKITYFVGSGQNLAFFTKQFKENKYNPIQIGHYLITYTYKIEDEYLESKKVKIDVLKINEQNKTVSLFDKNKLIAIRPICLLSVNNSGLIFYDNNTSIHTLYEFERKSLFRDYLQKIINIYK